MSYQDLEVAATAAVRMCPFHDPSTLHLYWSNTQHRHPGTDFSHITCNKRPHSEATMCSKVAKNSSIGCREFYSYKRPPLPAIDRRVFGACGLRMDSERRSGKRSEAEKGKKSRQVGCEKGQLAPPHHHQVQPLARPRPKRTASPLHMHLQCPRERRKTRQGRPPNASLKNRTSYVHIACRLALHRWSSTAAGRDERK